MIRDTSIQDVQMQEKSTTKRNFIITIVVLLVFAFTTKAFFFSSSASRSFERASLQIATLEVGDLVRDVVANGKIVAANAPLVYSPEQGFVELKVKAGDSVKKHQVIAEVSSPELENRLKQERSELTRLKGDLARQQLDARSQQLQLVKLVDLSKVDLEATERENRRAHASIEKNIISQIDYEKALDDLARAKLNYKHAKQEVSIAQDRLSFELESVQSTVDRQILVVEELQRKTAQLTILASVDGVVGNLLVQDKALVNRNDALMTLVDLTAYEAELSVTENYANEIGVGMPVEMVLSGKTVQGRLSAISPEVNNRQVKTRVRFDQAELTNIRQNQQVSARILLENKSKVLKVRRGSFLQAGGFIAYKIENGIATKTDIQIGATSMREVEILTGLTENDQIIISNYDEFINLPTISLN